MCVIACKGFVREPMWDRYEPSDRGECVQLVVNKGIKWRTSDCQKKDNVVCQNSEH